MAAEDYDSAKRIKAELDRARAELEALSREAALSRVRELEKRKAAAVVAEDYDLAKKIKGEIEALLPKSEPVVSGDSEAAGVRGGGSDENKMSQD